MTLSVHAIAVIGRKGQLARELADLVWPTDMKPHFLGRDDIDLFNPSVLTMRLQALAPVAIINTAAYTAVDLAESELLPAQQLNTDAPALLAAVARQMNVPLIHVSTDYVFSGGRGVAYREDDAATPLSVYGRSKRAGEIATLEAGARAVIVRTAGLFGRHGQNFLKTMASKAADGVSGIVKVVHDQVTAPTPAAALAATLQQMSIDMVYGRKLPAILHIAGQPPVSWFGFTQAIFSTLAANGLADLPKLMAVPTSDFPRPAPRPAFSALDCGLASSLGYAVPSWQTALPPLLARLTQDRIAA